MRTPGKSHEKTAKVIVMKRKKKLLTAHMLMLRKRAGLYLKSLRRDAGLTQLEVSKMAGLGYYTFISQIECGTGSLPPDLYERFAEAYSVPTPDFTKKMLEFYDPFTYKALYGAKLAK